MMSAPKSNKLHKYGVLKVPSTIKGMFASFAILEISGISIISIPGFPISSPQIHFVLGCIAFLKPSVSLGFTKVVSMPNLFKVSLNKLKEPP